MKILKRMTGHQVKINRKIYSGGIVLWQVIKG